MCSNIRALRYTDEEIEMCEITVERTHCYYANGILTHNCAQELRIPANLTLDEGFCSSFLSGGDVHHDTAVAMFGAENYDKEKRKIAKTFNFGLLYGMSTYSVAERYKISLDTAEKWVAAYENAHKRVFLWMETLKNKAKKQGTVYNYFGRPRRVKYWLNSSDSKKRAFGYRTVVNTSVQSVGADLLKLVLIRQYKNLLCNPAYKEFDSDGIIKRNKVKFAATIHDEADYCVDKDIAREVIAEAIKCQRLKIKGWKVPMDVGLEVGTRWGETFPFIINQDTGEILEPDGELVSKPKEDESSDDPSEFSLDDIEQEDLILDL